MVLVSSYRYMTVPEIFLPKKLWVSIGSVSSISYLSCIVRNMDLNPIQSAPQDLEYYYIRCR